MLPIGQLILARKFKSFSSDIGFFDAQRGISSCKVSKPFIYELQFTRFEPARAMWNVLIGSSALVCGILRLALVASLCYLMIPLIMITNDYLFKRFLKREKIAPGKQMAIRRTTSSKH